MLLRNLIFAIFILIITYMIIHKMKNTDEKLILLLFGVLATLMLLVYPLYKNEDILLRIISSIFYSFRSITMSQDFELIGTIELNSIFNIIYVVFVYILFLLIPLLTATAILAFISNRITKIKLYFQRSKPIIIFSEYNERTKLIAKNNYNKSKDLIIFANVFKKEDIDYLHLNQAVTDIDIRNKDITYYLFSKDEEKNLSDALKIINAKKDSRIKIYVLNSNEEDRMILDSCDKGNLRLEIINETDRIIYNLLYKEPLYNEITDKNISVLIVGCGKIGLEFLKTTTWCGQMPGYQLNINIIDKNADIIKEKLELTNPELINNYNYNFINADIYSKKALKELKNLNVNYILVSLGSDNFNLEVAIFLRRYFLRQDTNKYQRMPLINLCILDSLKKEQIDNLNYNFNVFGSVKEMYEDSSIIYSDIEQMAIQVHGIYDQEDLANNLKRYYETEYNRKSSRAVALHMKYKLFSVLNDIYDEYLKSDLVNNIDRVFKEYNKIKDKVSTKLIENEHERWIAYTRADGFISINEQEVAKYRDFTKDTKHVLAKLHPALAPFKDLERIGKVLNKDFIKSDKLIIDNIENILKKKIYKDKDESTNN